MNEFNGQSQYIQHRSPLLRILLTCSIVLMMLTVFMRLLGSAASAETTQDCSPFYEMTNSWQLEICPTDASITSPMAVTLNGKDAGTAAYVRFYHPSQNGGIPQVAVIYASGFVRLKQNADPTPTIPFGTSFVLGPAYWSDMETYHHNPQIDVLMIDTEWLAPLRMTAMGELGEFEVRYDLTLPTPRDRQTRLHVTQTYTATAAVSLVPTRTAEAQGFKLVQASSMFINEGDTCDGGFVNCHDSNGIRFIGNNLAREEILYPLTPTTGFLLTDTTALGDTWLDILHTDDDSWQGNTPNVRITLDQLPQTYDVIPQGWISATNDPTQDNVGVWLHSNDPAAQTWQVGESQTVGYWLLAQDNPLDPWTDLGLRSGVNFLDFEENYSCQFVKPDNPSITGTIGPIAGYDNTALQLNYDIGITNGNWAQIRCDFDPPLNLAEQDHLRFAWRGDDQSENSLEVGLVSKNGAQQFIFGRGYHHATQRHWWGDLVIPFDFLAPWEENSSFNPAEITAIFISVVKASETDTGGSGTIAFDHFTAFNALSRTIQTEFETVHSHITATMKAIEWLSGQQQPSGILKSWAEEEACLSYTYDQALALLVFSQNGRWAEADAIVDVFAQLQNPDGSWFQVHDCDVSPPAPPSSAPKWEGDIAWMTHALGQYQRLGGTHPSAKAMQLAAAEWLASRLNPEDGCLMIDHTEGTIDSWWALESAWPAYQDEVKGLQNCLLTYYWNDQMGRFKGGREWYQPYLDNQTWGAAFLKAIDEEEMAKQALSYAYETLRLPTSGGELYGFDGQGGPWVLWNEGIGQYVAVGGYMANDLLLELLAQQRSDGAMPSSPHNFSGAGVWAQNWHGVSTTAWLALALNQSAFHRTEQKLYLPLVTN